MPINSNEILWKFSTTLGSAGNSLTGSGLGSLGKYISTSQLTNSGVHDLFSVITGDENAGSVVDYRLIFIHNNTVTSGLAAISPKVYLLVDVSGGANVAFAADSILPSSVTSATAQASQIANSTTAPTQISAWNSGTVKASGLSLPDIPSGYVQGIWIRRSATNSAAMNNDGMTLNLAFDSAA